MSKYDSPLIKTFGIIILLTASIVCGIFYFLYSVDPKPIEIPFDDIKFSVVREYGLPVDSFNIIRDKIKQGENISELLLKFNVQSNIIEKIVNGSDTVFDLRKINAGKKFTAFCALDSMTTLKYLVYEHTPAEYLLFNFNDTNVSRQEKEIVTKELIASAKIESSLWSAMVKNDINIGVAIQLSEIYAWTIDFFDLKKNDFFKLIYEERFVDTISMGVSKIVAVCFNHAGKKYYAVPFVQNGNIEFFDETGNSLKKAFLKAPLKFARVSSTYTNSRWHPVLKVYTTHFGVDYAAPVGTPVHSIGKGKVMSASANGGAGNMIKIKHNSLYVTSYMHLSNFERGIKVGKTVEQGEIIGYVGSTGLSTGPHLDFRVFKNNNPIDPLKMESPPAEPIKKSDRHAFDLHKKRLLRQLDKISL